MTRVLKTITYLKFSRGLFEFLWISGTTYPRDVTLGMYLDQPSRNILEKKSFDEVIFCSHQHNSCTSSNYNVIKQTFHKKGNELKMIYINIIK